MLSLSKHRAGFFSSLLRQSTVEGRKRSGCVRPALASALWLLPLLLPNGVVLEDAWRARTRWLAREEVMQLPAPDDAVPDARVTRLAPQAARRFIKAAEFPDRHSLTPSARISP